MAIHLYVKKPALTGGANVEISAYVNRRGAPFFDGNNRSLVELGMRCYQGEASQGQFVFDLTDAGPEAAFPLGHSLVTLTEDAPGYEAWLFRGRVASDEGARGAVVVDEEQEWSTTVDDGNVDLRGQAFTEAWVRPEETDVARLVALQLYTLNGTSSTATYHRDTCSITVNTSHLAPNTNTVTMPAKKYPAGTQPQEVVQDCAEMSGKTYGVVIHHTGGSHLCLFYTVYDDHTTYLCPGSISDDVTEWDPNDLTAPVWEPHWEQGPGTVFNMQTMLSGMVGLWGTENVTFQQNTPSVDNYDYWVEAYHDGKSTDATQAAARTSEILFTRLQTYVTHSVSVIVNADQVDMIGAGMSIAAKNAIMSIGYPTEYFTRRIAECRFEPRMDGRYWAHLKIERPHLAVAPGRGQVGPYPPVQSVPPGAPIVDYEWNFDANEKDVTNTYPVGTLATNWHAGYVHTHVLNPGVGNRTAATKPAITPGSFTFTATYGRNPGTPYNPGGVNVKVYSVNTGVDTLIGTTATTTGTTTDSISVTVPAGGDHITFELPYNSSTLYGVTISHGSATLGFTGTALPGAPGSAGAIGTLGTSPIYMPIDTVLPAQIAGDTPVADPDGKFIGSNLEEVLAEFILIHSGGRETVEVHGSTGATETIDAANGNIHDITLTANCTITLTAVTADEGCSLMVMVRQDGVGGWTIDLPASVVNGSDLEAAIDPAASSVTWLALWSIDGGTVWYGTVVGGVAGSVAALDDLTDVVLTSPAADEVLTYDGANWVNAAVPSTSGIGEILIADTHSTPLIFADLLQNDDQDDLLYGDP